jgi:hypothetical protein
MMKHHFATLFVSILFLGCSPTTRTINDLAINLPIESTIDLTNVTHDKAPVTINPGRFTTDKIIYRLPKVIPGDYSVGDFVSFFESFVAYYYNVN